jgi:four helix bundle protein
MPIRNFRDFVCWQLSYELQREVFAFTASGPASNDFKFHDQIRNSSASSPRNIAEGFGRYQPAEFAQYLRWARASIMETQSSLIDARDSRYVPDALFSRLFNLSAAALTATTNLMLAKQRQAADARAGRRTSSSLPRVTPNLRRRPAAASVPEKPIAASTQTTTERQRRR